MSVEPSNQSVYSLACNHHFHALLIRMQDDDPESPFKRSTDYIVIILLQTNDRPRSDIGGGHGKLIFISNLRMSRRNKYTLTRTLYIIRRVVVNRDNNVWGVEIRELCVCDGFGIIHIDYHMLHKVVLVGVGQPYSCVVGWLVGPFVVMWCSKVVVVCRSS